MAAELTATPIERDIVIVTGEDALDYLQTQLSQNIAGLVPGRSVWSFILAPKSEIEAIVRVTRTGEGVLLDVGHGHGGTVLQRLDGPLFRMDVTFAQDTWPGIAWRGAGAYGVDTDAPVVARMPWDGVEAVDVVGPRVEQPAGVAMVGRDELDAMRVAMKWPTEREIDGEATPAMTGIVEHAVSFDKGCYTGQEFVARVHYRGATPPRRLVLITFAPGSDLDGATDMVIDGESVGTATSILPAAGIGLGYCKRSVPDGSTVTIGRAAASVG